MVSCGSASSAGAVEDPSPPAFLFFPLRFGSAFCLLLGITLALWLERWRLCAWLRSLGACCLNPTGSQPVDGGVGVRQDSNNFLVVVALGKGAAVEVDSLGVYCVPRQQFQFNLINRSVLIHFIPVFIHHVVLALGREGGREEGEGGM